MKTVAVSGYFDPLHKGHIAYIKEARDLGDALVAIVNNDTQARLKKGAPFYPNEEERLDIVGSLRYVDSVFLSVDTDRSVCKSLKKVRPDIFAKGGDRNRDEIPEAAICDELGIQIVDGLGAKIQSSSYLIERAQIHEYVKKPWGGYQDLVREPNRVIKEIDVKPGEALSLQSHDKRKEDWFVEYGTGEVQLDDTCISIEEGSYIHVEKGQKHRLTNTGSTLLKVLELQLGECDEDDIVRYEDRYGREER